jgi:hypothetical protein
VGIQSCSGSYWALMWLPFVLLLSCSFAAAWYLIRRDRVKIAHHFPTVVSRRHLSSHALYWFLPSCVSRRLAISTGP